jgi:hypothetical protein
MAGDKSAKVFKADSGWIMFKLVRTYTVYSLEFEAWDL